MSRDIRIGLIGLGNRGISLLEQVILPQNVLVTAVCDTYEDRREAAAKLVTDAGHAAPLQTDDYRIIEDYALVLLRLGMSERLKTEQRIEYYNKSAAVYELLMKMTNNAKEYVNNHRFVQTKISEIS